MIGIDMNMPKNCLECPFNDKEDLCYIDGTYAISDLKVKPHWCPLIDMKTMISADTAVDIVHKTIYEFFDIADDDSEEPMNEKDKLLLKINKALSSKLKDKKECDTDDP